MINYSLQNIAKYLFILIIGFFLGQALAAKKIDSINESYSIQQANFQAVKNELKLLRSEYHKIKVKKTIKEKNGTVKMLEKTEFKKMDTVIALAEKRGGYSMNAIASEKVQLKTAGDGFIFKASVYSETPFKKLAPEFRSEIAIYKKIFSSNVYAFLKVDTNVLAFEQAKTSGGLSLILKF